MRVHVRQTQISQLHMICRGGCTHDDEALGHKPQASLTVLSSAKSARNSRRTVAFSAATLRPRVGAVFARLRAAPLLCVAAAHVEEHVRACAIGEPPHGARVSCNAKGSREFKFVGTVWRAPKPAGRPPPKKKTVPKCDKMNQERTHYS